jgi:hypothetical protein
MKHIDIDKFFGKFFAQHCYSFRDFLLGSVLNCLEARNVIEKDQSKNIFKEFNKKVSSVFEKHYGIPIDFAALYSPEQYPKNMLGYQAAGSQYFKKIYPIAEKMHGKSLSLTETNVVANNILSGYYFLIDKNCDLQSHENVTNIFTQSNFFKIHNIVGVKDQENHMIMIVLSKKLYHASTEHDLKYLWPNLTEDTEGFDG